MQEFIRAAIMEVMPDIGNGPSSVPLSAVGFFDGSQAYLQRGAPAPTKDTFSVSRLTL